MDNHPQYINNRGEVVGFSNLPGETTNHAFLWRKGVMSDLGTLPGDFASWGEAINDNGEVGGLSCDMNGSCRAFLWQNDLMTDLNTLICPGSPLFLSTVWSINSRGEIVGDGTQISTGQNHAYLAIPCDENHRDVEGCDYSLVDAAAVPQSPAPIMHEPTIRVPRTLSGRRGLSHRHFRTQTGTFPITENRTPETEDVVNQPLTDNVIQFWGPLPGHCHCSRRT